MGKLKRLILDNRVLYNLLRNIVDEISTIQLSIFMKKIRKNKNFIEKMKKNKKYIIIEKGKYNYKTFSAFYLNNMLALVLKNLLNGYIPIVKYKTNSRDEKSNNWSDFFLQPVSDLPDNIEKKYILNEECINSRFKPSFSMIYSKKKLKLWGMIYNEFIKFNSDMTNYFEDEYNSILKGKRVLGVICRGTDYTATKPKYHPIQPDIEEIINEAQELLNAKDYDYIYLATEEEKYYQKFIEKFGKDCILTNKRTYYGEMYNQLDDNSLLYSVNFERENDQYLKGKEYLSSLKLLSCCNSLIGGHCGGSDLALYFNNCKYEYVHIYDKGVY